MVPLLLAYGVCVPGDPRVSFFMNKFRKLGYLDYNKVFHVHSSLLNNVVLHD